MRIVAVLGISGVGKSSLIAAAAREIYLLHLTASGLIKAQLAKAQTSEQLRAGPILDNQHYMLRGFSQAVAGVKQELVVFDGHNLIDTPTGILEIPDAVFAAMGLHALVFIEDAANAIADRRQADQSRQRPTRTADELAEQQGRAKDMAARLAASLGIPFSVLRSGDLAGFRATLGVSTG